MVDLAALSIVLNAVLKYKVEIVKEVLEFKILVLLQLALDGAKVHGVLDDIKVVRDVELLWIYRLVEDPCLVVLPKAVEETFSRFFPAITDWSLLRNFLNF